VFYKPSVGKDYEWINTEDADDYEVFIGFDGSPRAAGWRPVRVRRVRMDERSGFEPSDFPWLGGHVLIMRARSVLALRPLLEKHGEVLPLATDDQVRLFALNVTTVIDALDEQKSTILRFPGSGRIMEVSRPVFRENLLQGVDIFRLPGLRPSPIYVGRRFVDMVEAAGLEGLEFKAL
jgi:hypothetical protein